MESNHEISGRRKENSIAILPVVRVASFGAFLDGGTGIRLMTFFCIMRSKHDR